MNERLIAYLPMVSYPDAAPEGSVTRSVEMAGALGTDLQANAYKIVIPRVSSAWGDRAQRPDLVAQSRWRCQPAIMKKPGNSTIRRSKEWDQSMPPVDLYKNGRRREGP